MFTRHDQLDAVFAAVMTFALFVKVLRSCDHTQGCCKGGRGDSCSTPRSGHLREKCSGAFRPQATRQESTLKRP